MAIYLSLLVSVAALIAGINAYFFCEQESARNVGSRCLIVLAFDTPCLCFTILQLRSYWKLSKIAPDSVYVSRRFLVIDLISQTLAFLTFGLPLCVSYEDTKTFMLMLVIAYTLAFARALITISMLTSIADRQIAHQATTLALRMASITSSSVAATSQCLTPTIPKEHRDS